MSVALKISPAPPPRVSQNFAALRESGLELIRKFTPETWTDHNVHDPGVTILEAFSYAMTELGLRAELDVADLLESGKAEAAPELPPAYLVLPSGPISPEDLRKVLLDHPLLSGVRLTMGAEGEVALFEDPGADPPLSYLSAGPRVPFRGLVEAALAFEERTRNSNTYTRSVTANARSYTIDVALPQWDMPEAAPFRSGATVVSAALVDPGTGPWRQLEEPQSYFAELAIDYIGPDGAGSVSFAIVLNVTDALAQPALELPGILVAGEAALEATGAGSVLAEFTERVRAASEAVTRVSRYLQSFRNLGEDVVRISSVRLQEIAVRARIEVTGSTNLEQLLAEIFVAIDRALSPRAPYLTLAAAQAIDPDVEHLFDGPLLRHGFPGEASDVGLGEASGVIYVSDVLGLIMRPERQASADRVAQENPSGRDIVAVTDLTLGNFVNNRPITQGARDCLHLVEPDRYQPALSLAKSRITFVRNEVEVPYDGARVAEIFTELRGAEEELAVPREVSPLFPPVPGESLPVSGYLPFQYDLPHNYGLGGAELPASVGTERRAQALQAGAYLFLFEQFLSDYAAQLGGVNRFFSPSALEDETYFTQALFELPSLPALLRRFPAGGDWPAFVADPNNAHSAALSSAAESREVFLDRRNRMLDHLLARQGEEMVAWGQELHRSAQSEVLSGSPAPADLVALLAARRNAVNTRLIRSKAAFLADAPSLNAYKLQAVGRPWRTSDLIGVASEGSGFRFGLNLGGNPFLRSTELFETAAEASIVAEEAFVLAANSAFYDTVPAGGGRHRYRLRDGTTATARVVAESVEDFGSPALALAAMIVASAIAGQVLIEESASALERRICHLVGIRNGKRRRLLFALDVLFRVYDEVDSDGIIEKRWRLWDDPSASGHVLLSSPGHFTAVTDAEAVALAVASIEQVVRYGTDEWNYEAAPAGPTTFNFDLFDAAGNQLGTRFSSLASLDQAAAAIQATSDLLYDYYGAEGFHAVEHVMLRPRQLNEPLLSLPLDDGGSVQDPYGQRLSFVFPSGFARDFALPAETAPHVDMAPHRFRDPEFRRHVDYVVRQACPAHLLPRIYWVDRELEGSAPSPASFDGFEQRYFSWLETELVPGAAPAAALLARAELVQSLSAIANADV